MRILLASDGSPQSERARTLVGALVVPGTVVRVISVLGAVPTSAGLPGTLRSRLIAGALEGLRSDLDAFAAPLRPSGIEVEVDALPGRPASGIVAAADRWKADLLVVGSHARGAVGTALLGSVAYEVVDTAACPVLVARTDTARRIVLGEDGSVDAHGVGLLLERWAIFAERQVRVVSVVHAARPIESGIAPGMRDEVLQAYREDLHRAKEEHTRLAEDAAGRLREAGRDASAEVREGEPAEELIAAAAAFGAELIAVGTRGRTGLERLVLGSVARKILLRAPTSVLVARHRSH